MGKGIILRVLDGTVLSPELTASLGKLLPGYTLETYQKVPDYKKSYARRIQSLYDAFLFILDAYPLDSKDSVYTAETLKKYVTDCKEACLVKASSIEGFQKELDQFTAQLVQVVSTNWKWPEGSSVTAAIDCLNDAECYQMMMDPGRPVVATLSTLVDDKGSKDYVLQTDRGLAAHYPQFLKELEELKAAKTPKTPSWFPKLPEYQKVFFCHLDSATKPAELEAYVDTFIKEWEGIKSKHTDWVKDLGRVHENTRPIPDWFNKLNPAIKEMIRVLAVKPSLVNEQLKQLKKNIHTLSSNKEFQSTLVWVTKTPHWYLNLCKVQQSFLGHVLKKAPSTEEAMSYISSRLRTLPLPSNFRGHQLSRINAKGEVTALLDERFGSSHIASRDVLKAPTEVQVRHVSSNLNKVFGGAKANVPRFLQTLISPLHGTEYLLPSAIFNKLPPDLRLYEQASNAATSSKNDDLFLHNHPLNIAKYFYYTTNKDAKSAAILALTSKYKKQFPALEPLITDYQNTLNSSAGSATVTDTRGRELFLSSLEQLIFLTIGGYSYGSCVSGKDRKAIEFLHTDAMILFHSVYKTWPKFNSSDKAERARFVEIFASLYVSRHQQFNAGLNAPGSEGIKTPSMYLPGDIRDAIKRATGSKSFELKHDDRLATNNEVGKMCKSLESHFVSPSTLKATLMAIQLGEDKCKALYDALTRLINQKPCFMHSGISWKPSTIIKKVLVKTGASEPFLPTGIEEILSMVPKTETGANNVQRLAKIFVIILDRLKQAPTDSDRNDYTNSVYDRVKNLFKAQSANVLGTLADNAIAEWDVLYETSKKELATKIAAKTPTPAPAPVMAK